MYMFGGFVVVVVAVVWYQAYVKKNKARFWGMMREANQKHGTAFPTDASGMHLVLSNGGLGLSMVFDEKNRKVNLLHGLKFGELLDFSYFTGWKLAWTEVNTGREHYFKDVQIEFSTNDLQRPRVVIPMKSKTHGESGIIGSKFCFAKSLAYLKLTGQERQRHNITA